MRRDQNIRFNVILDALRHYSSDLVVHDPENPVLVRLNKKYTSIYVANIVPERETSERIDIKRDIINIQRERRRQKHRIAFVGIHKTFNAFSAWDPDHALSLQTMTNASMATRRLYHEVTPGKLSIYITRPRAIMQKKSVIAMNLADLGFYLENIGPLHRQTPKNAVIEAMDIHVQGDSQHIGSHGTLRVDDDDLRRKISYKITAYKRSSSFRGSVLSAYKDSCCICGRQLGIVEAAHIIPHNDKRSSDSVTNGLALCVEHHKLYDTGLLLPTPEYDLHFNVGRADYLQDRNLAECLDNVRELDKKRFTRPENSALWPKKENLQLGLDIRLNLTPLKI